MNADVRPSDADNILELARPELLRLKAYSHAAWEPTLERLHANESPWRVRGDNSPSGLNRYPEPHPYSVVARLAGLYGVPVTQVLAGRGSDEAIDLLVRGFCRAGQDSVLVCPPTFGMYSVAAQIQGARVIEVPLQRQRGFAFDTAAVLDSCRPTDNVKIVFVCSPNNPTGNPVALADIERLCTALAGRSLVAVDEAYNEFAGIPSCITLLERFPNLIVMRTLSKAYALAGARCGALLGNPAIIELLGRLLPPYSMPSLSIDAVLNALTPPQLLTSTARIELLIAERTRLSAELAKLPAIVKVWPSAANFVLVDCVDAGACLRAASSAGLLIRDLRSQKDLSQSLRISLGTPEQNDRLIAALRAL